jgi:dipeptidase E
MKLYLSSYRLGDQPERLTQLVGYGTRAAIIFNACDQFEERLRIYDREERDLATLGFSADELDLRSYFDRPEEALKRRLTEIDLLWVVGGNTFVLARAMKAARFSVAAATPIQTHRLTYAGYSAGVCVTGPDLEGIHLMDDPTIIPEGYDPSIPADTLGWIPWRIVPHWRSDHPEAPAAEIASRYMEERGLAHRTLRDGQVVIINQS